MLNDEIEGISLVVATLGEKDMQPLLDSLEKQTCDKYECIVVDQNPDSKMERFLTNYRNIIYINSSQKGNSLNRNIGIKHACMPILGFPDDDCFYAYDVLEKVLEIFSLHPDLSGVSGTWMDSITGKLAMGGKPSRYANYFNVWLGITNITMFLRADIVRAANGYTESFGLGSGVFEGGEETDLVLKVLERGGQILYVPDIKVWHRQDNYTLIKPSKQMGYEESWGALFRKWYHRKKGVIFLPTFIYFLFRSFCAAAIWALCGNLRNSMLYLMKNKARLRGWCKYGKVNSTK